ncbi:MAG: diacylglycerol/lipid kinase family protein [Actinomycetes bacterium]
MRGLLIANPKATATTTRTREVLVRALGSDLKLDVAETLRRGHARDLAREAASDRMDVVVALGGDGTVNEVVNGLLYAGPGPDVPSLAVVPGGSTNVFTRTLGLSREPVEATGEILDALRTGSRRVIGLGLLTDPEQPSDPHTRRWFTFCAGFGLDAEVVREVEVRRHKGRRSTPRLFVTTALQHFFTGTDRRHPAITVHLPDEDTVEEVSFTIVSNSAPWTYLGRRPILPTPLADFDAGLDLFALRKLRTMTTLRGVRQILASGGKLPHGKNTLTRHDLSALTLTASRPLAVQVDGEYIGEREAMHLASVPRGLSVIV